MKNKVFLSVLLGGLLITVIGIMLPAPETDRTQFLPWQIEQTAQGGIRVFGISLGETSLEEAAQHLRSAAKVTMFVSPEGVYKIEAYFDKVLLGGFSSKMVMVIGLSQADAAEIFLRGARISTLGSGTNKVTLASEDMLRVYDMPIASLAYLTRTTLDDELLLQRFGEPAEKITELASETVHWLYPELGLDIARDDNGKGVLQYVQPQDFAALVQPLRDMKPADDDA